MNKLNKLDIFSSEKHPFVFLVFLLFFLSALGYNNNIAFGCSCPSPVSTTEEFERANAVFWGKVTDIYNIPSLYTNEVKFDVKEAWKGVSQKIIVISTSSENALCGYPFEKSKEYLVYAYGEDESSLNTITCSRTLPIALADEDLLELGQSHITFPANAANTTDDYTHLSPLQQMKKGVQPADVVCHEGLVLMKKLSKNSVACVKPTTAEKLVERGWGKILLN